MKIGLLAYHAACNFGANLQILSTFKYFKNVGFNPIVINYIPTDLEERYKRNVTQRQYEEHKRFLEDNFLLSSICRSSNEIAQVISRENIDAVVIGSDAVAQCHKKSILFPSKTLFTIIKPTSDKVFPNPFWGTFNEFLEKPVPLVFLSASNQNSNYKKLNFQEKLEMNNLINTFSFISVRDTWTKNMFSFVSENKFSPIITPDPVFGFNENVNIPSKSYILQKFNLPDKYILISFLSSRYVSKRWLNEFQELCLNKGYKCIALPFPEGINFKHNLNQEIKLPLNPIDWYLLIKYSSGYVGNNMHPIVICLHNSVPFYSFDHYGISILRLFLIKQSSKIYDLLKNSIFINNWHPSSALLFPKPKPGFVLKKLLNFDFNKANEFSKLYFKRYNEMMKSIVSSIMHL